MNKRLSWKTLSQEYQGEWVELIDYDWDWSHAQPSWASVRHHASDRKTLLSKVEQSGSIREAVMLYVSKSTSIVRSPVPGYYDAGVLES